ncbi:MAG: hypothetical protein HKN16_08550 [Saprospiraceae bacterium]|nr:hypothetical protein [Saprospiraceae bacterium]
MADAKPEVPVREPGEAIYPPISLDEMQALAQNTTLVDYIFYNKDFSMSLDNQGAIFNALKQISSQAAPIRESCKPTGRVMFQGNGEIMKEADFYFEEPCYYFIFIEDDKPVKANLMTKEGVGFFNKILSGATTRPIQ